MRNTASPPDNHDSIDDHYHPGININLLSDTAGTDSRHNTVAVFLMSE
jgi:hypothetical protein